MLYLAAVALLFGLMYALDLDYPNELVQCSSRVQALKNNLLR